LSYSIEFSDTALNQLEALGRANAKLFRQVMMKVLDLRHNPKPQDCKKLEAFRHGGLDGYRVDQGEYRIIYAVSEKTKVVSVAIVRKRDEIYERLR
jgi:mRNA interferase RelE/StbE